MIKLYRHLGHKFPKKIKHPIFVQLFVSVTLLEKEKLKARPITKKKTDSINNNFRPQTRLHKVYSENNLQKHVWYFHYVSQTKCTVCGLQ